MQHWVFKAVRVVGLEGVRSNADADLGDPELARDTMLSGACKPQAFLSFPYLHFALKTRFFERPARESQR